jgi:hypothetical protein
MPPAVAIGASAVASIGGGILSSKAQKKAAKKAAKVSAQNTATNNALARETYNNNAARLDPYSQNGLRASNALTGLLLGPAPASPVAPAPTTSALAPSPQQSGPDPRSILGQWGARQDLKRDYADVPSTGPMEPLAPGVQPAQPGQTAQPIQQVATASPWDQFRNSTNYQFRFDEGMKGLNQGLAFNGLGDSGAAVKEALKYSQNFASNELGNYMNLLAGQQSMGLGASSALAGVGQNMVGQVTANNNQGAQDAANAALVRGQAQGNMYSSIAGGIGQIAGAFGSGYGGGGSQTFNVPQWNPANLAASLGR